MRFATVSMLLGLLAMNANAGDREICEQVFKDAANNSPYLKNDVKRTLDKERAAQREEDKLASRENREPKEIRLDSLRDLFIRKCVAQPHSGISDPTVGTIVARDKKKFVSCFDTFNNAKEGNELLGSCLHKDVRENPTGFLQCWTTFLDTTKLADMLDPRASKRQRNEVLKTQAHYSGLELNDMVESCRDEFVQKHTKEYLSCYTQLRNGYTIDANSNAVSDAKVDCYNGVVVKNFGDVVKKGHASELSKIAEEKGKAARLAIDRRKARNDFDDGIKTTVRASRPQ